MKKISIVIVDHHDVVRSGLKLWFESEPGIEVVAEATCGNDVLQLLSLFKPDVLLLALHLPDRDGHDVIREIRENGLEIPILAMTGYKSEPSQRAIQSGANGFLTKNETRDHFIEAIRWAAESKLGIWLSTEEAIKQHHIQSLIIQIGLTKTDLKILSLLELTNSQIAEKICLSVGTVKNHVTSIYTKLGVSTRIAAYNWALLNDII
jgi:DNA-binding NarL/FixJ family response regulator